LCRRFDSVLSHHYYSNHIHIGGVAKWLNAADCKSAPSGFGGSNPSPTTIFYQAYVKIF
jgi:hypothetical protein